jgi:hypothetical protein
VHKSHGKLIDGETFSLFMGLRFHDFGREVVGEIISNL